MTTVLVVDDEPIVRDVVARYLERDGHSILTADSGDAARGLIEGEAPSLVVLDVMLPGETEGPRALSLDPRHVRLAGDPAHGAGGRGRSDRRPRARSRRLRD